MTKRLISFLLAFSLILCLGACTKAPAKLKASGSGTEADPWTIGATATDDVTAYLVDGNRLMVSGSGAMMDFDSAESTPWASIIADLTEVNVFDGVTKIGNNAFKGAGANSETLDFYIPTEGLDEIGNSAFENANLNSNGEGPFCCISIMSDVKHVGSRAFANVGLTEVQAYCLADNIEKDAFADNSGKFYATALTGYNWDDAIIKEFEGSFEPHYLFSVKYKEMFNTDEVSGNGQMNVPDDELLEYDAATIYEEEGYKFIKYEIVKGQLNIDPTDPVINTELTGNVEMFIHYEKPEQQ